MPFTFTQIESKQSKLIQTALAFLIFIYFFFIWIIVSLVRLCSNFDNVNLFRHQIFELNYLLIIVLVSMILAFIHWRFIAETMIRKILLLLKAENLNPKDSYHRKFENILNEISIAIGGIAIEGVVIPTASINAFALSDSKGRNVIGITEGMLASFSRAEIECVVAHEASHIASRDCLETSIITSVFGIFSESLNNFTLMVDASSSNPIYVPPQSIMNIFFVYFVLNFVNGIASLFRMFISRARQYRADALAVKLTRNPLSLASALHKIKKNKFRSFVYGQELSAIFIVNPNYLEIDEEEGIVAELFSTHPSVSKRIDILLAMAHADKNTFEVNVQSQSNSVRSFVPNAIINELKWMLNHDGKWIGPHTVAEILRFDWVVPETWVVRLDNEEIRMICEDDDLKAIVIKTFGNNNTYNSCPLCKISLMDILYEGTTIKQCHLCKGILANESDVQRILIRHEIGFSEALKQKGNLFLEQVNLRYVKQSKMIEEQLYSCPCCKNKNLMVRVYFSAIYQIEIDKCLECNSIWFDRDELEILQYVVEKKSAEAE